MHIIGITSGEMDGVNRLNKSYVDAFTTEKTLPIIIPVYKLKIDEVISENESKKLENIINEVSDKIDILVVSGGNDINPTTYGENNEESYACSYNRDLVDDALIRRCIQRGKPIVGICRGFQILGSILGMKLTQDLNSGEETEEIHSGNSLSITNRTEPMHFIELHKDFKEFVGHRYMRVNSWHHQGMLLKNNKNPKQVEILARTKDVIEGFRHKTLPIIGMQFHPEDYSDSITIKYILNKLIK